MLMDARGFRQLQADRMSEDELLSQVRGIARDLDWLVYHTYRSTRSEPGFPDLVLVRGTRIMFRELKKQGGRTTKQQAEWIHRLEQAHVDVAIWRPADLVEGRIARELRSPGLLDEQLLERVAIAVCTEYPRMHDPVQSHELCRTRARMAIHTVRRAALSPTPGERDAVSGGDGS